MRLGLMKKPGTWAPKSNDAYLALSCTLQSGLTLLGLIPSRITDKHNENLITARLTNSKGVVATMLLRMLVSHNALHDTIFGFVQLGFILCLDAHYWRLVLELIVWLHSVDTSKPRSNLTKPGLCKINCIGTWYRSHCETRPVFMIIRLNYL